MAWVRLLSMLVPGLALAACANAAPSPVLAPAVDVVVAAEPEAPDASVEKKMPPIDLTASSGDEPLPKVWSGLDIPIPKLPFAEALHQARSARDAFVRLPAPATASEPLLHSWFTQVHPQMDQATRLYAAAFYAQDAPREGRIDAISEAADLDLLIASTLERAGLDVLPAAWRSDRALASTFEDVAVGPTRRWREEARQLAWQCVHIANESAVATPAAQRCGVLHAGTEAKHRHEGDAGGGCACDPGDPLCSASLGGWCGGS